MDFFEYRDGKLFAEGIDVNELAKKYGTPAYVYSRATFERHFRAFDEALAELPHLVCYAVKANSNIAVLNLLARLGAGFDIVSGGELERVLAAGGDAAKVVFSGVGKSRAEMQRALQVGIYCFNVESEAELELLNEVAAELDKKASISIRVNPDVDAKTHPYISTGLKDNKFGIDINDVERVYKRAAEMSNITINGVDCHIGSQLTDVKPFIDALDRVLLLIDKLQASGIELSHIDLGGGLGIQYKDEQPPTPAEQASALVARLKDRGLKVLIEPGRAIAGNAGILLTEVMYLKHNDHKNFAIVDAAMNDLMRPTLYGAWQEIVPAQQNAGEAKVYDLVGPICETGDFLGKDRQLFLQQGDILAVRSAGAYGFSMSSNYNSRGRAVELMVDKDQVTVVREREQADQLFRSESLLADN
ncbi:MAG: diaminopimelate decarboxylase [Gammaproteobacteria bacterium]|nr:diaminopimelate decarboxylase [Gammaproteobacteria bacterium]